MVGGCRIWDDVRLVLTLGRENIRCDTHEGHDNQSPEYAESADCESPSSVQCFGRDLIGRQGRYRGARAYPFAIADDGGGLALNGLEMWRGVR